MVITIHEHDSHLRIDKSTEYTIDLDRKSDGYENGDLICFVRPFSKTPLVLEMAINTNGDLKFRSWTWNSDIGTEHLHTNETPDTFTPTQAQIDTVNGLHSGRIRFENIKLDIGMTVRKICPIDEKSEEKRRRKIIRST